VSEGKWVELEGGGSVWVTEWDIIRADIVRGIYLMGADNG